MPINTARTDADRWAAHRTREVSMRGPYSIVGLIVAILVIVLLLRLLGLI